MPQHIKSEKELHAQRFFEERRGLLTDEVHLEKYADETNQDFLASLGDEDIDGVSQRDLEKTVMSWQFQEFQKLSTTSAGGNTLATSSAKGH